MKTIAKATAVVLSVFGITALPAPEAHAQQCGWFAIGSCTTASRYPKNPMGWGMVKTSEVQGFRNGYRCIVSGPQTKSGARRDRNILKNRWGIRSAYIKRGCSFAGE